MASSLQVFRIHLYLPVTFSMRASCYSHLIHLDFITPILIAQPVPVAARSKAWVCSRSPAEIVGSNPNGSMDFCLL